jgi:hypothetical protein
VPKRPEFQAGDGGILIMATFNGACACGNVRFHLSSMPMIVHCCHCRDCQRQTGTAFVLNALIETDRIHLDSGVPSRIPLPTDSGKPHDVYRCPSCQTALWSDYGGRPGLRFVRVGTLAEPGRMVPDVHIFTRSKLPWVVLPPDALAFEVYYDQAKVWSAESLARRRAAGA